MAIPFFPSSYNAIPVISPYSEKAVSIVFAVEPAQENSALIQVNALPRRKLRGIGSVIVSSDRSNIRGI